MGVTGAKQTHERQGESPEAEHHDQHRCRQSDRAAAQQPHQLSSCQARRHEGRKRAEPEGEHQAGGEYGTALATCPDERAVDQPAG